MSDTETIKQLSLLCQKLGANERQAGVMAAQLLKRADQLAGERHISRVEALDQLVGLIISGQQGQVHAEATENAPHSPPPSQKK